MSQSLTPPLKWHGGKHYLAQRIIELMPRRVKNPNAPAADDPGWVHYVEPFFGGGAVLLQNDPEGISEVVNDINRWLISFWRVLGDEKSFKEFQRIVEAIPFSQEHWERADGRDTISTVEDAVTFFVRARQSRQGLMKDFATMTRARARRGMNEQVSSWLGAIKGLADVHARLKRVVILNDFACKVIPQQDGLRTLFYCDPPYLHETRVTTSDYAHEMNEAEHAGLLGVLSKISGRFILSGYRSALYDKVASTAGWRRVDIKIDNKASSKSTKEIKVECLWMNYEPGATP